MTPGLTVHAGLSGSGKTHAIKQEVWEALNTMPVIVIDRMREWDFAPAGVQAIGGGTEEVLDVLSDIADNDTDLRGRLAVIRPDFGEGGSALEQTCRWAIDTPGPVGIAIPEAHRAFDKRFTSKTWPATSAIITEWRHHRVKLWADTQRFSLLNTDVVELSRSMRLFAMNGRNDLAAVRDIGGDDLVEAIGQCADKLAASEPGWHVSLDVSRRGPYEIERL
jgi:hypothetical protein